MKPAPAAVNTAVNKSPAPTPKPAGFRRAVRVCLLLCALLIAATLALPYALPWLLQQQDIDFTWQHPQWHLNGLSAANVQLTLPNANTPAQHLKIDQLRIEWAWQAFPIKRLQAQGIQAYWPLNNDAAPAEQSAFALPQALLRWLPQQLELKQIDADLPGIGRLQGSLQLQASSQGVLWQPAYLQTDLTLDNLQGTWLDSIPTEFQPTQLTANITTHPDHQHSADDQQLLVIDLHSLGPMRLQINGLLDLQQTPSWQGSLTHAQIFMQLDELTQQNLQAEHIQLQASLNAQADTEGFSLSLGEQSHLLARHLKLSELGQAQALRLDLSTFNISGLIAQPLQAQASSVLRVQLEQLQSTQLHAQDWTLAGQIDGQLADLNISAALTSSQGISLNTQAHVLAGSLQGRIQLDTLSFTDTNALAASLRAWPEQTVLNRGQLSSAIDFSLHTAQPLEMQLQLQAQDLHGTLDSSRFSDLDLNFHSPLKLQFVDEQWQAHLDNAQLSLELANLRDSALQAQQLQVSTQFNAQADANTFSLTLDKSTQLQAQQLKFSDAAQANSISLQLPNLQIKGASNMPSQATLHSSLSAQIKQLSAEQLHTQNWDVSGTLSGALSQLKLKAELSNTQGLKLNSHMQLLANSVQGQVTLDEVFFKAGNPLQTTLKDWPELISFTSGRINGSSKFTIPYQGAAKLSFTASGSGLSGIVNRSELSNLSLDVNGQLTGPTLKLSIPTLTVEQLDPGVPIGPIELRDAHYQANTAHMLEGLADWQHVQANLLNGRVWLNAQQLDLKYAQSVLLQVEGLELQELFRVYPAEGLTGSGTIDGQLPLYFDHDSFSVKAGQLQARAPGVLQFQSDKINALGKTNPSMRLVADALEDFHFNLLSCSLSYDESGKLLLNVRLQGQNPDVEKGRPINLNVNLEEDIPALLASIQLSNQVSEIIQKRVRERLEKR